MTEPVSSGHDDPRAVRRGRIIALAIFAIALLPIVLATWMYFGGWGAVGGAANKGQLLQPVGSVADLGLQTPDGKALMDRFYPAREEPRWLVLTVAEACDPACRAALHDTRQVHIALGKESDRVERGLWVVEPAATQAANEPGHASSLAQTYPDLLLLELAPDRAPPELPGDANLQRSYQTYVIDPNGNVVLRYDSANTGKHLLKDLKKLLRLSNIG